MHSRVLTRTLLCAAMLPLATLTAAHASAQGARIGAIYGATFSTLNGLKNVDQRTGTMGGLTLQLPLSGAFSFQPELLFVSKGAKSNVTNGPDIQLDYAEVPLLLRFAPAARSPLSPHIYAGPYLGLQIDCEVTGSNGNCDDVPGINTKSVDLGGVIGAGVDLDLGGLVLTAGGRYGFGVSKIIDFTVGQARDEARNGVFALYGGVSLRFGKR